MNYFIAQRLFVSYQTNNFSLFMDKTKERKQVSCNCSSVINLGITAMQLETSEITLESERNFIFYRIEPSTLLLIQGLSTSKTS